MKNPKRQALVPGSLDMLILKTLASGSRHGYAIACRIRETSRDILQVEEGSLYPALHRMEQRGWISSSWGASELNRRAKYYELTPDGKRQLREETRAWQEMSAAIDHVLGLEN